jgi:hypothetical protein
VALHDSLELQLSYKATIQKKPIHFSKMAVLLWRAAEYTTIALLEIKFSKSHTRTNLQQHIFCADKFSFEL